MEDSFQQKLIKLFMACGGALGLIMLVFWTLTSAATTPASENYPELTQAHPIDPNNHQAGPTAMIPGRQQNPTTTIQVQNPDVPPLQPQGDVPLLSSDLSTIPDWVKDLKDQIGPFGTVQKDNVTLSVVVGTTHPNGDTFVYNGDQIVYTITITNNSAFDLTNVQIFDFLPANTFADSVSGPSTSEINCTPAAPDCTLAPPSGAPSSITWAPPNIAANGGAVTKQFRGTIVCQPDNTVFENEILVTYDQDMKPKFISERIPTTARVRFLPNGTSNLAGEAPSWCSQEKFVLDLDWGDFDNDGDLDLALAASIDGVKVYRNDQGQLTPLWSGSATRFAAGVLWADVDNNGTLDLIVLGDDTSPGGAIGGVGSNYIYTPNTDVFIQSGVFTSSEALYKAVATDFNKNDNIHRLDIAAIRYYSGGFGSGNCQAYIYRNNGSGGYSFANQDCIFNDTSWVRSIAGADYDNDGDLDLAIGGGCSSFCNNDGRNRVYVNNGAGAFPTFNTFETFYPAYALDWGDFNGDGNLDLAAGFSAQQQVRVYPNTGGQVTATNHLSFSVTPAPVVRAVGWGNFTEDKQLELAVGSEPPGIYQFNPAFGQFVRVKDIPSIFAQFVMWRVRAVDHDNDADIDIIFSNSDNFSFNAGGPTLLLTNFASPLSPTLTTVGAFQGFNSWPASSVAWGDADGDGDQDLLFGASANVSAQGLKSKLYLNVNGTFPPVLNGLGNLGPHGLAFGDHDGNNVLDIALSTPNENQIYLNGNTTSPILFGPATDNNSRSLAWGDVDFDDNVGTLELLVGNSGASNLIYEKTSSGLSLTPIWNSNTTDDTRSVAWADIDNDHDLDFAVGNFNGPNYVYRNNGDRTFTLLWTDPGTFDDTRSLAWADYDRDGFVDLGVGNFNEPNLIYRNIQVGSNPLSRTLSATEVWSSSTELSATTSIAWGDWNNDGTPDLAVGNTGQPDQVYANTTTASGQAQFAWLWKSTEALQTSGVAWGDRDNDGDLDLAISQEGNGNNGFYENNYVVSTHLEADFAKNMPLPNNPAYVSLRKPGQSEAEFFFGSAEILSGPANPTVTLRYRLFDPDGSRQSGANLAGDRVVSTTFEYSVDGGGTWRRATPASTPNASSTTSRLGTLRSFVWNVQADQAISDNARFRITIIHQDDAGPVQRATTRAVSPPFRVRGLTCRWPDGLSANVVASNQQTPLPVSVPLNFTGVISEGSGVINFSWDFGDGSKGSGPFVQHTYKAAGLYNVVITATGTPCPITSNPITKTLPLLVGLTFTPTDFIYLPLVQQATGSTPTSTGGQVLTLGDIPGAPAQVTGLSGQTELETSLTRLTWHPNPLEDEVQGYRLYRSPMSEAVFRLVAELSGDTTTYTDDTASCEEMYLITAYNTAGESLPSTASYFTLPCR